MAGLMPAIVSTCTMHMRDLNNCQFYITYSFDVRLNMIFAAAKGGVIFTRESVTHNFDTGPTTCSDPATYFT